ncbi:N-terminal kinase-like protein [Grifola frondosa]|uniref:N-terminal kinase-like protein n=1 Tax=Grifola frondosa TaxID=5627 RepID=A0A1C7LVU5_GRIFR|nr:N-terminal kinase-like protein [Grifola frondosa]
MGGLVPDSSTYASPEVKKNGWSSLKELNPAAADAYALGLLIHFVFNPSVPLPATAHPPHPPPTASSRGSIPASIFPTYKRLLNPNPKARLTPAHFLDLGMAETAGDGSGFFASNRLVKVSAGLDNFNLASEAEKALLLRTLKESASSFPTEFASYRILPSLISALEFGGASAAAILPLVLQFGKGIAPADYASVILVHLVKLYTSPDRGTRMALLDHLSEYADKLDKKMVVDKIWPNLQTGFTDTVAIIREATVKSIILLSDKFNERIMNNDLLRHLAKMQADPEPSIRTNTCILIGRLGPSLGYNTKRKVLVPAFARALKDPFVHARVAGLMALMATVECFDIEDLASKVIPNMAFTMVDQEKLVRDQAFKAMELFVKKLEEHAAAMPETAIVENDVLSIGAFPPAAPGPNTLVNSAAGAAGALAGWAISSLGKKLAAADLQSTMGSAVGSAVDRSTSAPLPLGTSGMSNGSGSGLAGALPTPKLETRLSSGGATRSLASTSSAKAMHLGASKASTSLNVPPEWAEEAAAELEASQSNPWGNDDLMDVNADQDDWSAFESAAVTDTQNVGLGLGDVHRRNGSFAAQELNDPWADLTTSTKNTRSSGEWGISPRSSLSVPPARAATSPHIVNAAQLSLSPRLVPARSPTPSDSGRTDHNVGTPSTLHSTVGMSKEEKAAEMARRKEERKQRIAALKEHKKQAGGPKP